MLQYYFFKEKLQFGFVSNYFYVHKVLFSIPWNERNKSIEKKTKSCMSKMA